MAVKSILAKTPYILLAILGLLAVIGFASVSIVEAIEKPHSLRGIAHGTSVDLLWQPPTTAETDAHRYTIIRKVAGSNTELRCNLAWSNSADPDETWADTGACTITVGNNTLQAQNTAYNDANFGPGKYIYRVIMNQGVGSDSNATSFYKAIVIGRARTMAEKYKAYHLQASATGGNVDLKWGVISTSRVGGYKIKRKAAGGEWETLVADTNSGSRTYTDSTVSTGTKYAYRVQTRYRPSGCYNNGCEEFGNATRFVKITP